MADPVDRGNDRADDAARAGATTTLPRHVTTPLLSLVTEQALEEDYRQVAERRAGRRPSPRHRMVALAVVGGFGLLISVAAVQNSRNEAADDAGRATLIARIEEQRAALEQRQDRVADLTRDNAGAGERLEVLTSDRQSSESDLRRLQAWAGFLPVTGEGIRITVEGNPTGDENQQVRDSDLALLVDGLFGAGAEAIAINDQRLNNLGSIRNTGAAINVNTRPLTAPYVVRAIGDSRTLQADLVETTHGLEFISLADQLGFVYSMQRVDQMTLPAARQRPLRQVRESDPARPGIEEGSS